MSLLAVVTVLLVVGILLGLVKRVPLLDGTIARIITFVVVLAVVVWLLQVFGLDVGESQGAGSADC